MKTSYYVILKKLILYMNIKIILFGKDGMLGNYIYKFFKLQRSYEIIGLSRQDIDINNITFSHLSSLLDKLVDKTKTNVIINCVGLILQVKNTNIQDNLSINSIFPSLLDIYSKFNNVHYIQPTTDCVFDGKKGNYTENDIPTETNIYGRSKYLGEKGTVIRVSYIGEEIKHKYELIEWVKSNKGKEINGYIDHYWNGITCLEYCSIIKQIIEKNLYWEGVRHIYSDIVSKYELVELINKIFNFDIKINKFDTKQNINKTLASNYKLDIIVKPIKEQIEELYIDSKLYIN